MSTIWSPFAYLQLRASIYVYGWLRIFVLFFLSKDRQITNCNLNLNSEAGNCIFGFIFRFFHKFGGKIYVSAGRDDYYVEVMMATMTMTTTTIKMI